MRLDKGQTLMEVLIVITIGILVIGALVFATIASLRNAQFAKNQVQATKLAQEGIEKMRTLRDRNDSNFNNLWDLQLACPNSCYYYFHTSGTSVALISGTEVNYEDIDGGKFQRQFKIEDTDSTQQKKITSIVRWRDFSGFHESKLTTILREI